MAKKKEESKTEKIEREYIIPLREKIRPSPRYKKTPKAIKSIKEFLVRHMKIRDGDLKKIKIDRFLNEEIWIRGIKNPVHKIKVKAIKEGDIVRAYSGALPPKINFKKLREEKLESEAKSKKEEKKTLVQKAKETLKGKKEGGEKPDEKSEEEKKEEKEKEESSKIAQEQTEKEQAKSMKHTTKVKSQDQKRAEKKGYDLTSRGH
ncbi:50S ribosomal protein L31e [Candidatus Pacearchaeota archaeon]|nr:50S ribosomal protein L31e [Candidatus Pacearchaeota archaeon]